jgi:hypothetical protein
MAKSFVLSMMEFFGKLPGQQSTAFGKELNQLSYEEKLEFVTMLRTQPGFEDVADPTKPSSAK